MKRLLKDYIVIGAKGVAMGAADVVPGVSGGTIAFISGIYEELLMSISNINLNLFKTLRNEGVKKAWTLLNGNFLISLFLGVFLSVVSLAKVITWLLNNHSILLWSFFFGLVLASIIYVGKQVRQWSIVTIFLFIFGSCLAYFITMLTPIAPENPSLIFMFFAGATAICAMILPGISGSFILVLLGAYKPVLNAVNKRDIPIILTILTGAFVGILIFSKLLKWLFENYKDYTLAILTGFILGSLNKIWPWKKVLTYRVNSHGEKVPFNELSVSPFNFGEDPQLFYAIILSILGFSLIILLEKIARDKS